MGDDGGKPVASPGFSTSRIIIEQLHCQTHGNYFVVWDRIEGKERVSLDVWHSYNTDDGTQYFPLEKLPWPPVMQCEKYESELQLYKDIYAFITEHLDVANELYYDVYTCFVLATWRAEDFKVVPYLFFLGPMASGKTRGLECFNQLCYRPILAASISAASLFRVLEAWHPTLLLDETEIYNKESMAEVLSLLNSGYRKGQCALRIKGAEQGNPQIGTFDVFGFKALAGTEELAATLQSRCIITPMSRAVRKLNLFMDEQKAQKLRNQLLRYRFQNLGHASEDMISDFVSKNEGFRNARVIELFISLLQVAPTEEVRKNLVECMKQITQSRLNEEQASFDARVFDALLKCEKEVKNGKISTQAITEAFNDGLKENDQAKSRSIGRRLAALGFEKCKVGDKSQAGFYWDTKLIGRLKARYLPTASKSTPETAETSETPVTMGKDGLTAYLGAEVSGVSQPAENQTETATTTMETGVSGLSEVSGVKTEETSKPAKVYTENPLCRDCKQETVFSHEDDAKTSWYKCPNNHYTPAKSKLQNIVQPDDKEETANTYSQLVCYFCQKPLMDNDREQSEFTEGKPAHKKCCDEKRAQLKQSVEMPDFEEKCQSPEEES
jgi:hypothetical protein